LIAQIQQPMIAPRQVTDIPNEWIFSSVAVVAFSIISALLVKMIAYNDQKVNEIAARSNAEIKDLQTLLRNQQEDLRKVDNKIIRLEGECIRRDEILRIEAKLDSIHHRIDEITNIRHRTNTISS